MPDFPRRCGVLGDPVAHSLSPVLHRAGYAEAGLDWSYEAHRVPAGGLAAFVSGLDEEWRGLSVTMPLKHEAFARADRRTPLAELSGVVNTLVLDGDRPGEVLGDNTDLPGAVAAVRERTAAPVTSAVVLGGGATAASLGLAMAELGARRIHLVARTPRRAEASAASVARHPGAPEVDVLALDDVVAGRAGPAAPDAVVSTIPADAQTGPLVERFAGTPCLFDALYDPWPTPLARAADRAGGAVVSGLDLLVHQAALQFLLFTGLAAPLAAMRAAGERALAARHADGGAS